MGQVAAPGTLPSQAAPVDSGALQRLADYVMPYGKYKDRPLAELPGHYLGWFARNGFPEGELGRMLALMYELDHNGLRELLRPLRASGGDRRGGAET
ncbi:hypothetical protein CEY11_21100 [Candidimonas nitroreducens]|uniref:Cytoplasmic protein n=1 Tax=Candidimonas nitroreducens TaxID=683354 RepID=A0A225M1I1_9BURK|nr:hypothetical protein CEY11_21100 [Candidimonas nitroreducens]